ncbi:hypothetical protein H9Q13_01280 [Pontibacter sp. JH31]|uniref:STAS/SEC14 domain-containing protein n=1 Tax=Pontibacter aquaedesilientis TaxID=2766980 RepID=A0ABR7XBU2_9BACT|nr:hypothetical protein [Pontibacter aquaedesilientis]MBD1395783.1 hypothetical protein [Pontibacter aquaedesilientis]
MFEKKEIAPSTTKKELQKANGDIFLEIRRMSDNSFIATNWIGLQSLETVMMGSTQILTMLRERPCKGFLHGNHELIGPWEIAVNWLVQKWMPQAKAGGIRYYAYVQGPGIYGQRSFDAFYELVKNEFEVKVFTEEEDAKEWLQEKSL